MKLTTIKSARKGATSVHLGENIGWSSLPFCGAMKTGRRELDGTEAAHGTVNCRPCVVEANARYLDIEPWVFIGPRLRNLIQAVRDHAIANYGRGAWDIIVEAFSDSELAEVVRTCQTARGAIRKVAKIVKLYTERRAPHDAEIAAATESAHPCGIADHEHTSATSASQCVVLRGGEDKPAPDETDGSVVSLHHAHDGELLSATRTWPGKRGHADIDLWTNAETYVPGWRGQTIRSANLCGHDAPEGELCQSNDCRRTECCPF